MKNHIIGQIKKRLNKIVNLDGNQIESPILISTSAVIRNSKLTGHVKIEDHVKIIGATITGNVRIGKWTVLAGPGIDIYAELNPIEIGGFCSIAKNVSIQEYNHNFRKVTSFFILKNFFKEDVKNDLISRGGINIGNDVWIGTQSIILSGAQISDGCVIGANSVVTGYLPPFSIAVGSPARVIKYRFDESIIEQLLHLKWWNWSDEKIKINRHFFQSDVNQEIIDSIIN